MKIMQLNYYNIYNKNFLSLKIKLQKKLKIKNN